MPGGERILVAAGFAKLIEPLLVREFGGSSLEFANSIAAVQQIVADRMRFDVVVADLTWDGPSAFSFDGLDVLEILRAERKPARVIFAAQGLGSDRDHVDEAVEQPEVAGIFRQATGPELLCRAIRFAFGGDALPVGEFPPGDSAPDIPRIHGYFSKGRGLTAARMAGAIASGRAVNHETLASAAAVALPTAARLVEYLGPLIKGRGEHGEGLKMTPEAVYRWCGEHERYILSWCRRNGLRDLGKRATG